MGVQLSSLTYSYWFGGSGQEATSGPDSTSQDDSDVYVDCDQFQDQGGGGGGGGDGSLRPPPVSEFSTGTRLMEEGRVSVSSSTYSIDSLMLNDCQERESLCHNSQASLPELVTCNWTSAGLELGTGFINLISEFVNICIRYNLCAKVEQQL